MFLTYWTGKGPMRGMYEERIRKLRLRRVAFRTMWLSPEEYPLLLGNICILEVNYLEKRLFTNKFLVSAFIM
jgi:hypothetical protein